jgi:hypothetical protein
MAGASAIDAGAFMLTGKQAHKALPGDRDYKLSSRFLIRSG